MRETSECSQELECLIQSTESMLSFGSLSPKSLKISHIPLVKVEELICMGTSLLAARVMPPGSHSYFWCGVLERQIWGMRGHICMRVVLEFSKGKKNTFQMISVFDFTIHFPHFQYEL